MIYVPSVSAVVINYNGVAYSEKCIRSLLNSDYENLEVILVDNGSSDGSSAHLELVFGRYENFSLIQLDQNFGPAYARNVGVSQSTGNYICFLDNDTEVEPDWASHAVKFFHDHPKVGIIQCKLILAQDKESLDYVGEFIGPNGFLVQRVKAGTLDSGEFEDTVPILAAKSAGMFITREAFDAAGGFDPDYFIYVEETDLGWRVWLSGFEVWYVPTSKIYHEFGTSSIILTRKENNWNAKFHGCKNYVLTLSKNLGPVSLLTILPKHVMLWVGMAFYSLVVRFDLRTFVAIFCALTWNVKKIRETLKKRKFVQDNRKIKDKDLFPTVMQKRPFWYFLEKAVRAHSVGNAEGFIKGKR